MAKRRTKKERGTTRKRSLDVWGRGDRAMKTAARIHGKSLDRRHRKCHRALIAVRDSMPARSRARRKLVAIYWDLYYGCITSKEGL